MKNKTKNNITKEIRVILVVYPEIIMIRICYNGQKGREIQVSLGPFKQCKIQCMWIMPPC